MNIISVVAKAIHAKSFENDGSVEKIILSKVDAFLDILSPLNDKKHKLPELEVPLQYLFLLFAQLIQSFR